MSAPTYPEHHVPIAREGGPTWLHAIELAACMALGQRALVIGPPASGKTTILRELGKALVADPIGVDVHVVLVDRPVEEFLEWRYELPTTTVHGTSSEDDPHEHADVREPFDAAIAAADQGRHTAILVDSIAALARALNATLPHDERILSGGIMATALNETRRHFAAARALSDGGSVTVVATASTDTESELDEVVLHELVGTGNMEIRLDADAQSAGLFPPVDILGSGARHTELIVGEVEADRRAALRAKIGSQGTTAGLALLLEELDRSGGLQQLLALHDD